MELIREFKSIYMDHFIIPKDSTNLNESLMGFLDGSMVKNPQSNAGDTGSIPGLGRSHMLWSS